MAHLLPPHVIDHTRSSIVGQIEAALATLDTTARSIDNLVALAEIDEAEASLLTLPLRRARADLLNLSGEVARV